jgi:hypothetical protein
MIIINWTLISRLKQRTHILFLRSINLHELIIAFICTGYLCVTHAYISNVRFVRMLSLETYGRFSNGAYTLSMNTRTHTHAFMCIIIFFFHRGVTGGQYNTYICAHYYSCFPARKQHRDDGVIRTLESPSRILYIFPWCSYVPASSIYERAYVHGHVAVYCCVCCNVPAEISWTKVSPPLALLCPTHCLAHTNQIHTHTHTHTHIYIYIYINHRSTTTTAHRMCPGEHPINSTGSIFAPPAIRTHPTNSIV